MNHAEHEEMMRRASEQATRMSREAQPTCKDCKSADVFFSAHYKTWLCAVCYAKRWAAEKAPPAPAYSVRPRQCGKAAALVAERMAWASDIRGGNDA